MTSEVREGTNSKSKRCRPIHKPRWRWVSCTRTPRTETVWHPHVSTLACGLRERWGSNATVSRVRVDAHFRHEATCGTRPEKDVRCGKRVVGSTVDSSISRVGRVKTRDRTQGCGTVGRMGPVHVDGRLGLDRAVRTQAWVDRDTHGRALESTNKDNRIDPTSVGRCVTHDPAKRHTDRNVEMI